MKRLLLFLIFAAATLNAHDSSFKFKGKHSLACYHECDSEALYNIEGLKETFLQAIEASGAHTLSYTDHVFEGGGYTLIVLLSESHATLHTYPEYKSCFIDLFTSGDYCDAKLFHHTLVEYLKPGLFNQNLIERN